MPEDKEFYSFEEALDELRLKEEELKRLVSEGEIRAFRKGDTMKLRRSDVESLRAELSGGEVVDLGDVSEELVFEDDTDLDDAGMATQEISDVDTIIEEDVEDVGEIDLEDEDETLAPARPVRRQSAVAAAMADEEEHESTGFLAMAILTTVVMIAAMPVALAVSSGTASDMARTVAGLFASVD